MQPTPKDNTTLSISSPAITDCRRVAEYFRLCQIPCHVTPNHTVIADPKYDPKRHPHDYAYTIENGCQIKFGSHPPQMLNSLFWTKLKNAFRLQCAHVHVEGKFKGCIYDYLRGSNCPA